MTLTLNPQSFSLVPTPAGILNSKFPDGNAPDPVAALVATLNAGAWVVLNDWTAQPNGYRDETPSPTIENYGVEAHQLSDWGTSNISTNIASTLNSPDTLFSAWSGGTYIQRPGQLTVWAAGGGHAAYGGNEVYTFDVRAAADSLNKDGDGGVWEMPHMPGRISEVNSYPDHYPYDLGTSDYYTWPPDAHSAAAVGAPSVTGPQASHTYNGVVWDAALGKIVYWPLAGYRESSTQTGGWFYWNPDTKLWEVPANGAYNKTGSGFEHGVIKVADGIYAAVNALWAVDRFEPETGTSYGGGNIFQSLTGGGARGGIAGPSPSVESVPAGTLGAWIFGSSLALLFPRIDDFDATWNSRRFQYVNLPSSVDRSSGQWVESEGAFLFAERVSSSSFTGKLFKATPVVTNDGATRELIWDTVLTPSVALAPANTSGSIESGLYGRGQYFPEYDAYIIAYDGVEGGIVGIVRVGLGV